MKKLLVTLLTMILILSFVACKSELTNTIENETASTTQTATATETPKPTNNLNTKNPNKTAVATPTTTLTTNPTEKITPKPTTKATHKPTAKPTEKTTPQPTKAPHVHSYGQWNIIKTATCTVEGTQERVCSCGQKETQAIAIVNHNYKDGACLVCKKPDATYKDKEIAAENERHNQVVNELKENRDYLVELNQGRIDDIKSQYGISYVYDDITCVQEISSLRSQISDLDYQISRLEIYNDPSDRAQLASLRQQKNSLEQSKTKYEQMRKINSYQNTIESTENNYQNKLSEENSLHQQNLSTINAKYS